MDSEGAPGGCGIVKTQMEKHDGRDMQVKMESDDGSESPTVDIRSPSSSYPLGRGEVADEGLGGAHAHLRTNPGRLLSPYIRSMLTPSSRRKWRRWLPLSTRSTPCR
jgi:hypothetical protein